MSKLFIGPYQTGIQLNLQPWLINQEAFVEMINAYIFRGHVKKKDGIQLIGRLHLAGTKTALPIIVGTVTNLDITFNSGVWTADLPISPGTFTATVAYGIGINFADNSHGVLETVGALPVGITGAYGTIDYVTGIFDLYFIPEIPAAPPAGPFNVTVTAFLVLPKLPVMGIGTKEETNINQETTIVFDTKNSYDFNQGTQQFRDISFYKMPAPQNRVIWSGNDSDFFWSTNYYQVISRNIFWETNNVIGNNVLALTNIANNAGTIRVTVGAAHGFIVGDVIYLDEVSVNNGYNGLTANVTGFAANTIDLDITFIAAGASTGWVFALTRSITFAGDGIKYYDGFGVNLGWRNFEPPLQQYSATVTPNYLQGCLILISYKDRLLAFNTLEGPAVGGAVRHANRVRWSQNGTPFYANVTTAPLPANQPRAGTSWVDNVVGKGGYIDAPTAEAIVSVALYKDTCLVFFERSTWQLRYTGNEILPFVWERINEQMGAESTFSPIYFDEGVLAVGDKGIIAANSFSVERIDQNIPDLVYAIYNASNGTARVHGIRNFQRKMCYWLYPNLNYDAQSTCFPDRILVYNYEEKCFSLFENSHTCFGNLQTAQGIIWGSDIKWSEEVAWNSGNLQSYYPHVIVGNQVGFIHYFDNDVVINDESMDLNISIAIADSITNTNYPVAQVNNHNLRDGQFVRILDTTAFPINVAGENEGNALIGTASFTGTLVNSGLFAATLQITVGANIFVDLGNGTLAGGTGNSTIDYATGVFTVNFGILAIDTPVTANYIYNWLNFSIFKVQRISDNLFSIIDQDTGHDYTVYAAYQGAGTIQVVDNFNIKSKLFNPFLQEDTETRINYLNTYLTHANMDFILNIYGDDDSMNALDSLTVSNKNYYNMIGDKVWNRIYPNITSSFFQLEFTMNDAQMYDFDNVNNDFQLHAMILDVNTGARLR